MFNKMKRFVAILLSALMLVSALPTSALAEPVGDSSVASQFAPAVDRGAYRAAPEKVSVGIDETTSLNGNGGDGWLTSHQWTVTSPRNWEDYIELSGTNGSHPRVKGVAATPDGSPVVIKHEYGGIWSTNEETFYLTVLCGERTITYVQNPDGNGGGLTTTQTVETGSTLTFPELFEGWENGDKVFAGWSTDRTGQTSEGADGVFRPNILWTSSALTAQRVNRDVTFYAIWIDPDPVRTKSAFFHIRLDGQIPFEPATYNASGYTENHGMTGTIKNPVAVNNSTSAVAANIASAPSYAEILRKLKAAGRYSGLTAAEFEAQYEVIWYVIKLQCTDADDDHDGVPGDWHVDGIVVPRANHQVYYSPNGGTNAPDSHSESAGSNVTVRFEPQPIRPGYEFLGWSEDPDATAPTYTEEGLKNFEMPDHDVTL